MRYLLDIRSGCAAIRDTQHSSYDPSYQGLHHDTPDVVEYKHGKQGTGSWVMDERDVRYLKLKCDQLNQIIDLAKLLALAISIAADGFKNRLDKGGKPYILHCIRVMMKMTTDYERILAILHDCVEDKVITIQQLRDLGFPEDILADLVLLTHDPKDEYDVYIKKLSFSARATNVKLADLEDNSNITRLKGVSKKDIERLEKYHKSYLFLINL